MAARMDRRIALAISNALGAIAASPAAHAQGAASGSLEEITASISYKFGNTTYSLWSLNLTDDDSWSQAYDVGAAVGFAGFRIYGASRPPMSCGKRRLHTS